MAWGTHITLLAWSGEAIKTGSTRRWRLPYLNQAQRQRCSAPGTREIESRPFTPPGMFAISHRRRPSLCANRPKPGCDPRILAGRSSRDIVFARNGRLCERPGKLHGPLQHGLTPPSGAAYKGVASPSSRSLFFYYLICCLLLCPHVQSALGNSSRYSSHRGLFNLFRNQPTSSASHFL